MAESNALIGMGSKVSIFNSGTSAYDDIAELTNITLPDFVRDAVEATHMQSPDETREYIAGLKGIGEMGLEMNYIPSDSDVILAAQNAGKKSFRLTFPNNVTWTFTGIVTKYSPADPMDNKLSASVSIQVNGGGVWAS